jgi:PIN like domain
MRFFFDRNMSIRIARMVHAYESDHTVRHHDEDARFHPRTTDEEWITALGKDEPPWVVLSGDGRILTNKVMRARVQQAGLIFFYMASPWMKMKIHEYAWKFMRIWPVIVDAAQHSKGPLFEVAGGRALTVRPMSLSF